MADITEYQRRMIEVLSYVAFCRFYIARDSRTGNLIIKKSGKFRLFIYYAFWVNGITKISYLILAYHKLLPGVEVDFLDQMGMWDWFLCFSQLIQETNMLYRKQPMYEILRANWQIQETVYQRLGSPKHVEKAILKNDQSLLWMHVIIVTAGLIGIMIQFSVAPKYAAQIYSIVPADTWYLRIIFCMHEVCYVYHIWVHQAWSIMLCEVFANSYTHIIREMTITLEELINLGQRYEDSHKESEINKKENRSDKSIPFKRRHIWGRRLDPTTKVPGTNYDIMGLLKDYQKVVIATDSFNNWCGKLMGPTMGSNYSQFVSDVFMMIQLLKEPETDALAVFFYGEDACAGMVMLFRMLIILSRVYPTSEQFLQTLNHYLVFDTPLRPYLLKYKKGLQRVVASKLGGHKMKGISVPQGVHALINYYIVAAMWQRPVDRRT